MIDTDPPFFPSRITEPAKPVPDLVLMDDVDLPIKEEISIPFADLPPHQQRKQLELARPPGQDHLRDIARAQAPRLAKARIKAFPRFPTDLRDAFVIGSRLAHSINQIWNDLGQSENTNMQDQARLALTKVFLGLSDNQFLSELVQALNLSEEQLASLSTPKLKAFAINPKSIPYQALLEATMGFRYQNPDTTIVPASEQMTDAIRLINKILHWQSESINPEYYELVPEIIEQISKGFIKVIKQDFLITTVELWSGEKFDANDLKHQDNTGITAPELGNRIPNPSGRTRATSATAKLELIDSDQHRIELEAEDLIAHVLSQGLEEVGQVQNNSVKTATERQLDELTAQEAKLETKLKSLGNRVDRILATVFIRFKPKFIRALIDTFRLTERETKLTSGQIKYEAVENPIDDRSFETGWASLYEIAGELRASPGLDHLFAEFNELCPRHSPARSLRPIVQGVTDRIRLKAFDRLAKLFSNSRTSKAFKRQLKADNPNFEMKRRTTELPLQLARTQPFLIIDKLNQAIEADLVEMDSCEAQLTQLKDQIRITKKRVTEEQSQARSESFLTKVVSWFPRNFVQSLLSAFSSKASLPEPESTDMDQLSQNTAETIKLSEKLVEEKPKHLSSLLGKTFAFLGNKANALIRALGATLPASSIREQRIKSTINHIQSPTIGSNASLAIRNKLALNTHISRWLSRGLDEKQRKLGRAEQDLLRVFQRSIA